MATAQKALDSGKLPTMIRGRKYRITYRLNGQRRDHKMVAVYLDSSTARWDPSRSTLYFSMRPVAGTQTLDSKYLLNAEEVQDDTKCMVD